jgi:hypothetical protein
LYEPKAKLRLYNNLNWSDSLHYAFTYAENGKEFNSVNNKKKVVSNFGRTQNLPTAEERKMGEDEKKDVRS